MSVTNFFTKISVGFQILYSLLFDPAPEYAYYADNSTMREREFATSPKDKPSSTQAAPEQATTSYSTTENHENMSSDWIKISLNPILTIADVEELHNQLTQYLGQRVQLSGKDVQRIDTASLQLLLAFMLKADITVCWVDYSEHLCESARLLGISTPLGLPTDIHG